MLDFTLYTANCVGMSGNCLYPNKVVVKDKESFKEAVKKDHVTARYKGNYRSSKNFQYSDCVPLDCDNDHSDNPKDWVTPFDIAMEIPGVAFAVSYSRHHNLPKYNKSARPRFHIFFPIEAISDEREYSELKKKIASIFPYFDTNALDSARFLFGSENTDVEFYKGDKSIVDYLEESEFAELDAKLEQVPEGKRNSTMSHIAGKIIKRYGNTDKAYEIYLEKSELCNPPLSESELNLIWKSASKFGDMVAKQKGYIPPEQYNSNNELKPEDYSDIGQAKVIAKEYEGEMAYTDSTDFMCFNGTRWVESRQMAVGNCEEFLDCQLEESETALRVAEDTLLNSGVSKELIKLGGKALEKTIDDSSRKAFEQYRSALTYKNFVMKRRDMKYVLSALQAVKPILLHQINEFDSKEFLLNTPKATYDLREGLSSGREHNPEDYITKITFVSPSEENMSLWLNAVNDFFCNDADLIDYVQQTVGLVALGKVYQEALIIAYGEGSNGKSTFWNSIARVLGSYSGTMSADSLTVGCKRNVKPEMAELKGKRLVIAAELEEGMRLNTSIVKQLCSTDEVTAEKKYKDPFSYVPTHTLVLYTNHLPKVGANDDGTWRRLIVIPFNAKIKGKSDIRNYADYLVENAGGAILTWIIEGAKKVIDNHFRIAIPKVVMTAMEHYRDSNDWLSAFFDDCCELEPSYVQRSGEFYQEYRMYCQRNGEYTRSTRDFYSSLEMAGIKRKKTKAGMVLMGVRLKSDFLE